MQWSRWYLIKEAARYSIKRYARVEGKTTWQRHPADEYAHLTEKVELQAYLERLNHRYKTDLTRAKEFYDFKHKFISQTHLDDFRELLHAEIPDQKAAGSLYTYLTKNCLHWFINQLGKTDPTEWKLSERKWGVALCGEMETEKLKLWSKRPHPDTISKHRQVLNRFLKFMHERMPKEMPAVVIEPLSKAQLRMYKAEYMADDYEPGLFITDADWREMEMKLDDRIRCFVQIGYYYGLRRNECMALSNDGLYEDHVEISRQLKAIPEGKPKFGPPKNRKTRRVPHWFVEPSRLYKLIEESQTRLMHPETFSKKFAEEMDRLKLKYTIHDLRRTFITRAFRINQNARDIQIAVGHANITTTMRYAQDDRDLGRKKFVPTG